MKRLFLDEDGSILTEYGILVVIIAVGLIAILGTFRVAITEKFQEIMDGLTGANATSSG